MLNFDQYSVFFTLLLLITCSSPEEKNYPEGRIEVLSIMELNDNANMPIKQVKEERYFQAAPSLLFEPQDHSNYVLLKDSQTSIEWTDLNYLVLEVFCDTEHAIVMNIDFFKTNVEEPQISARIGLNPRLQTQVILPLSYLDGQEIFMNRFPRQLKGTVLGRRMYTDEIDRISIRINPLLEGFYQPKVIFNNAFLSENLPEAYKPLKDPVLDELGQWKEKDWPGKTKNEEEMIKRVKHMEENIFQATYPDEWNHYGGNNSIKLADKGFFRVQKQGEKWWFVDPDGCAFLSTGVDVMLPTSFGPVEGVEDLFDWIPDGSGDFSGAVSIRNEKKQVSFLTSNLIRVFGNEWREKWETISANLMKTWRFNTIANWSDSSFIANSGLPYVLPLSNFPITETSLFRDFPDVFNPTYKVAAAEFAQQLEPYKNDTLMIGYFLRNEPHWGFGAHNLAYEMLSNKQKSATKTACIEWLSEKYTQDISSLNSAWNSTFSDFESIGDVEIDQMDLDEKVMDDLWEFSGIMVDEYVKVVSEEVKKVDPNHLNLGMRFASISTDLFYRTGAFVDVFSINQYSSPNPPPTQEIYERTGKPVIIGEFHHGATDRGLPASGIRAAKNQKQRGVAFRHYLEQGFARPEVIGMHYFQWNDQPWTGRYDGENYQIGVMDVTLRPYEHWVEAATLTNERIYKVASGLESPFNNKIEEVPYIYY